MNPADAMKSFYERMVGVVTSEGAKELGGAVAEIERLNGVVAERDAEIKKLKERKKPE